MIAEIQRLAREFDEELKTEFGADTFKHEGCVFLGWFYAQSPRIFFGLNPGSAYHEGFKVELGKLNAPFDFPHEQDRETCAYWRNCKRFLRAHSDLNVWFNDRVTSTFLVPWRTPDAPSLYQLNRRTAGKLFRYSRELVNQMIEHHHAEVLSFAGKQSLWSLNEFLNCGWTSQEIRAPSEGPGGVYQWRKRIVERMKAITVFQIPHFSRAGSLERMASCAEWLRHELRVFSLNS